MGMCRYAGRVSTANIARPGWGLYCHGSKGHVRAYADHFGVRCARGDAREYSVRDHLISSHSHLRL
eukprot:5193157-Amphidinium_carterae.1